MNPNAKWKQEFEKYLAGIPNYYYASMRNGKRFCNKYNNYQTAMKRIGAPPNLIPDHLDSGLNYSISTYLKKVKQQVN